MRYSFWLVILLFSSCTIFQKDREEEPGLENEEIAAIDLEEIRKKGKLVAIVDNSSTSYFIYKGQPMGYEHDLLKRFCSEIGVDLEIRITKSIDEAISMLNSGEGDLVAYLLTVTKYRRTRVDFTDAFLTSRQVLVQKKPEGWRRMWSENVSKQLIRNQVDLIGKEVNVRRSSSFINRLNNLSDEIGGDIIIVEEPPEKETEDLIREVLNEKIRYTIADEPVAMINAAYYPDLDVETPISFPQQIAWAVRKTSPELLQTLNEWIDEIKKSSFHQIIYNKYFRASRQVVERARSDYSSITGNRISEYDEIIRKYADQIHWDWKLIASQIYQESRFNTRATSWVGAEGLMQVMPVTGNQFGASRLFNPEENIMAGTAFLKYLDKRWIEDVPDSLERVKFILASYNAGVGHVQDAVAIAKNLGLKTDTWNNHVAEAMKLKSKPEYFRMEGVRFGYCRGESVAAYVEGILSRYREYLTHFGPETELTDQDSLNISN